MPIQLCTQSTCPQRRMVYLTPEDDSSISLVCANCRRVREASSAGVSKTKRVYALVIFLVVLAIGGAYEWQTGQFSRLVTVLYESQPPTPPLSDLAESEAMPPGAVPSNLLGAYLPVDCKEGLHRIGITGYDPKSRTATLAFLNLPPRIYPPPAKWLLDRAARKLTAENFTIELSPAAGGRLLLSPKGNFLPCLNYVHK